MLEALGNVTPKSEATKELKDLWQQLGLWDRVAPVSYTHLDVYKRQAIDNPGESGFGEKIVRKMLDSEVAFAKDSGSTAITRDNYDFLFVREDEFSGKRCYVLELLPRQRSKNLLRGTIWVDANTYLPYRVEGEPAKSCLLYTSRCV